MRGQENVRELDHAVERGVLLSPGGLPSARGFRVRAQAAGGTAKLEEDEPRRS